MIHSLELRHYFFRGYLVRTIFFMVDLAGVEPASRTLFSLLHTAITYILYLVFINSASSLAIILYPSNVGWAPWQLVKYVAGQSR